ncbi:MAG TPA: PxKF domain-containing protein, partial [Nitrososphaera sp.]|nr:PxKF domain-containing protein [Nitrososphaera sp.]
ATVTPLKATKVTCDAGAPLDEIEALATGGTALRYDATGGQFIYNWQTPKQHGACYHVTVTTQDASSIVAEFKLR